MSEPIDWLKLSQQLKERRFQSHGITEGPTALELIIGEDTLRYAVDYYVALKPESELARSVLWKLHPWSAMQRCYEIYHSGADIEQRRSAVELLRVVADYRALAWVDEFLADPDEGIQNWGIGVLDQLLWGGDLSRYPDAPEKAEKLLTTAESHSNPHIRDLTVFIREYLSGRNSDNSGE